MRSLNLDQLEAFVEVVERGSPIRREPQCSFVASSAPFESAGSKLFFVDLDLLPRPQARGLPALFRRGEIGDIAVVRKRRIAWPCGIGGGQSHRDQPPCNDQTDCGIRIEPAIECATVFRGQGPVAPSNVVRDHGSSPVAAEH